MRIGELSKRTGLTVETLRFYERAGVLGAVTRDASGYRVYDDHAYRILVTVRWAQELGFRLEDIATILGSGSNDVAPAERITTLQRLVDERLAAVRTQIERLETNIERLEALRATPFDGTCIVPAEFVDELVRAHERDHGPLNATTPNAMTTTRPRRTTRRWRNVGRS